MTSHRLDAVALALNHLILIGRTGADGDPSEVEVALPSMHTHAPILASLRFDRADRRTRAEAAAAGTGYILICPLDYEFAKHVFAHSVVSVSLLAGGRVTGAGTQAVSSLYSPEMQPHEDDLRLMSIESAAANPVFFALLASILDGEHRSPTVSTRVEHRLVASDTAFVVTGQAEGVGEHDVAFILDDFGLVVNPERVLSRPGEVLEDGSRLSRFICVDTLVGECSELRLAALSGSSVRWSQVIDLTERVGPRTLLKALSRDLTYHEGIQLASSADVLQRIAAARPAPQATEIMSEDQDRGATPELSIIIPFYGDAFFLIDHLESQRRTSLRAEWIFVCDDPLLLPEMTDVWRLRGPRKTSRLIGLSQNAGYAAANNIGFRRARADIVALMNSDVYWSSLAPLEYGARLLRDDESIGAVGFTLRYEDDTIQHAGMTLRPVPDHDHLLHWVHPGKGLPAEDVGNRMSAREVEAVTGALMLVRRRDFDSGVFDEGYVGGDYEDGDLCLSLRARGKRIMLVECDGLYHLERHSIASASTHWLVSAINAVRFNRKWTASGQPRAANVPPEIRLPPGTPAPLPRRVLARSNVPDPVPDLARGDCAIHAHIFYPDLIDEMLSYLTAEHLAGLDTYVTVVDDRSLREIRDAVWSSGRSNIRVVRTENGGRDLAPLFIHNQDLFRRYRYVCHLHSKKSPHTDFGDEWRRYLFDACIGSAATVERVLSRFRSDPALGVAFPKTFPKIVPFTRAEFNTKHIDALLKRLNSRWQYQSIEYPAGSMCWLRSEAFLPVLAKMPSLDEIETESGQLDETWAHAMERCLTLIPKLSGFSSWSYPIEGHPQ